MKTLFTLSASLALYATRNVCAEMGLSFLCYAPEWWIINHTFSFFLSFFSSRNVEREDVIEEVKCKRCVCLFHHGGKMIYESILRWFRSPCDVNELKVFTMEEVEEFEALHEWKFYQVSNPSISFHEVVEKIFSRVIEASHDTTFHHVQRFCTYVVNGERAFLAMLMGAFTKISTKIFRYFIDSFKDKFILSTGFWFIKRRSQ